MSATGPSPNIRPDHARAQGGGGDADNAGEAEARRLSQSVPIAKADRRAGVRANQASTRISTIPAADSLEAVQAEWALICTAHNLTKLAKAI